jgi:hypothetical protein
MTTQRTDSAGSAGGDDTQTEQDQITVADAAASMAKLREEAGVPADAAPVEEESTSLPPAGDEKPEGTTQPEGGEGDEGTAPAGPRSDPPAGGEAKKPDDAKPAEAKPAEDDDDQAPAEAKQWHPKAQKHIQKILGEKKALKQKLAEERKVIDEFAGLANSVGVPPDKLPGFLQLAGKALLHGDAASMDTIGKALVQRGWKPAGDAGAPLDDGMLAEVAKAAADAALESFDAADAAKKAMDAVRSRRAGKPQSGTPGAPQTTPAPQSGKPAEASGNGITAEVRDSLARLGADVQAKHGADAGRIAKAMAAAIESGKVPRDPADWPNALELVRDAEVARIAAERARSTKAPPPTTTTTTTRTPSAPESPRARLMREAGVA